MTPAQRDAAIRRAMQAAQRQLYKLDEESQAALMRLYEWARQNIAEDIARRADAGGTVSLTRLADLRQQIEDRLGQLVNARNGLLNESLGHAARIGAETFVTAGVEAAGMMRVPDEALRFLRNFVAADGLQLSDRIWRIDRGARDAVVNAVERAIVMGDGAAKAAREFLSRGQAVPADVQDKLRAAGSAGMAREASDLMIGQQTGGGTMGQAMRVFRTEINRVHGVAYLMQAEQVPGFVGIRFTLSPQHPKPDICDELAKNDSFGLGDGVFPNMTEFLKVWPAHPNTFSFPVAVFGPS